MSVTDMGQPTKPPFARVVFRDQILRASEMASAEKAARRNRARQTVTVPLRLEGFDGVISTIQLRVVDVDHSTEQIFLDGQTIGFISRAGGIFVAQSGVRLDRAEECGQCLSWDKAAKMLAALQGSHVQIDKCDPHMHETAR